MFLPLSLCLEVELQREFHYSATMLINDLAKIVRRGLIVMEATGGIADIVYCSTSSVRHAILVHVADRVERQVDVT